MFQTNCIRPRPLPAAAGALVLALAATGHAAVNDVFPGEYTALPSGLNVATLFLIDRSQEGWYLHGRRVAELDLDSRIGVLRLSRGLKLGDYRAAGTLVLPVVASEYSAAWLKPGAERRDEGPGDLRLAGTVWVIDEPQQRHYLGLTALAVLPTGTYSGDRNASAGENRWVGTLMAGWIRGLSERFTLDVIGELAWYGDNDDQYPGGLTLSLDPAQALTGYLRYHADEALQLFAGWQENFGGAAYRDGEPWHGAPENQRAFLGALWRVNPANQINLRYHEDLDLENGMRNDGEWQLRWAHFF